MMLEKINQKRFHTQIIPKAETASTGRRRQKIVEQSMLKFNLSYMNPSKTLLNELDNDYSKITPHKKINLDETYKISLFTYSQQFYNLEMTNYIFPMRLIIRKVKNQGTIFIGYDQEYPGIYQNHEKVIFDNKTEGNINSYDFKLAIKQDLIILLRKKGTKLVKNIYFTIIAGKSLFLCDFKVQFCGSQREIRTHSEAKFRNRGISQRSIEKKIQPLVPILKRAKSQANDSIHKLKQFVNSKFSLRQNMNRTVTIQQPNSFNQLQVQIYNSKPQFQQNKFQRSTPNVKNFFATIQMIKDAKKRGNSNNAFRKASKKEVDYKLEEAKRNKEMLQQFKVKDKQLKQTASKCKILIENYKKAFNEQNLRKSKLNKDLVLCLYSAIFINQAHKITDYLIRKQKMMFRVDYWCTKFVKNLKKTYKNTCKMLPYRSKRLTNEGNSGIYMISKLLAKQSTLKAQKIVKQTLICVKPSMLLRHVFSKSKQYRAKLQLIQRTWKLKYQNRLQSMLYFVDNHLPKMFKELSHLRLFSENFYNSKSNLKMCLAYIKGEAQKYRSTYQAYLHKTQEKNEVVGASQAAKKKNEVPIKQARPFHRFFRNLDTLKSMIRTWFQLEYKKFLKKSAKKIYN